FDIDRRAFKPRGGLQFAGQPAPHAAAIIDGAIAKGAQTITLRLLRGILETEQRHERLLQDIFGLAVAEAKSASVEDQRRRFGFVKRLPPAMFVVAQVVKYSAQNLARAC